MLAWHLGHLELKQIYQYIKIYVYVCMVLCVYIYMYQVSFLLLHPLPSLRYTAGELTTKRNVYSSLHFTTWISR